MHSEILHEFIHGDVWARAVYLSIASVKCTCRPTIYCYRLMLACVDKNAFRENSGYTSKLQDIQISPLLFHSHYLRSSGRHVLLSGTLWKLQRHQE